MSQPLRYRTVDYEPVRALWRWWPLARREATSLFTSRWGIALYALCFVPFLVRTVILLIVYGVLNFGPPALRNRLANGPAPGPAAAMDPRHTDFYAGVALDPPALVFVLLLSSLVVARSIARDRTTNALELYWTRGITPGAYVLAKWVGGLIVVGSITVLAPLALWLLAVGLAEDWSLLTTTVGPMARALVGLLVVTGVWTAIGTFVSAAAHSANGATVVWTVLLVGSSAVGALLAGVMRSEWLRSCVSMWEAGATVVRAVADVPQRQVSVPGALFLLGGLLSWTWWRARRRMRLEEALG